MSAIPLPPSVIPAKAGIHGHDGRAALALAETMGSRFRGNDEEVGGRA
jgi:hypothetical protein